MSSTRRALPLTLAAVLLTAFSAAVSAQPRSPPVPVPAPAPGPDCFTLLLNMSDCLTYVEQGSNLTNPEKPCCSELAGVVDSDPICLCQLLGNAGSFGVRIDLSRALKLPDACQVSTPPVSLCPAVGAPSLSPSVSPDTEAEASTPSAVSVNNDTGASSSKKVSALVWLTGLALGFLNVML